MWKRWKIFEDFDKLFEGFERLDFENLPGETKYWGYEAHMGPDGIPHVRTFGNVGELGTKRPKQLKDLEPEGVREPYADVIVDEKAGEVIVTAEMPGVDKKDVKLHATEKELEIKAETKDRKYHKLVPLTREIDPEKTHSTYNNGIMEIKAPLKGPKEPEGFDVKVE
jgi:HSP20 family protein